MVGLCLDHEAHGPINGNGGIGAAVIGPIHGVQALVLALAQVCQIDGSVDLKLRNIVIPMRIGFGTTDEDPWAATIDVSRKLSVHRQQTRSRPLVKRNRPLQ